jgi:hypothetical protein
MQARCELVAFHVPDFDKRSVALPPPRHHPRQPRPPSQCASSCILRAQLRVSVQFVTGCPLSSFPGCAPA